jgi:hypothetical protein
MALDIHRLDNNEYLFGLDSSKYEHLFDIFESYLNWTGIYIDEYGDTKLAVENQKTLIKIIDKYVENTNINLDKKKTITILEFRGMLNYFINSNISIELLGD